MSQVDNGGWSTLMSEIQRTERLLPRDEIWAVAATQVLGELILDLDGHITPERRALLIGVAAMIAREGNREIMASLHADLVLRQAAVA
jgi:hypothetical protein